MLKRSLLVLILLTAIVIIGCSNETVYILTGEGERWTAQFKVVTKDNSDQKSYDVYSKDSLMVTYKGNLEELSSLETLYYQVTLPDGTKMSVTTEFSEPPHTTTFSINGSGTGYTVREGETVHITVEWDGKSESFSLAQ